MNNITFEQLPQAVSMLIEKVGLLTDKVEKVLGMAPQQHGECRTLLTLNDGVRKKQEPSILILIDLESLSRLSTE